MEGLILALGLTLGEIERLNDGDKLGLILGDSEALGERDAEPAKGVSAKVKIIEVEWSALAGIVAVAE